MVIPFKTRRGRRRSFYRRPRGRPLPMAIRLLLLLALVVFFAYYILA